METPLMHVTLRYPLAGILTFLMPTSSAVQTPAKPPATAHSPAAAPRKLSGDNDKLAKELDGRIETAIRADHWEEAIARANDLVSLRRRAQGPEHFETVTEEWRLKTLRRVSSHSNDERAAYQRANTATQQADILNALGQYAKAQPLYEKALEIRRRLLNDDYPETATSYNDAAYNLSALGKHSQAQALYEKALEIKRRLLTDEHPDTATAYNNVAVCLNAQGKYVAAQPFYEKALEIHRRILTDDHHDTATNYNNVAYNLEAQGKYAAAQPLYEKALEINRRILTENHPDTSTSYGNLANNMNYQGNFAQAQPLFEKALEISRRALTDGHPATARCYNNLAHNLNSQGKFARAQPFYEKALEIRRRRLTDNHPDTARSYNNLAHNFDSLGKYVTAQPLYEKSLEIRRRILTDDHPDTAQSYNNLAMNLDSQGENAQAQPLYEKALEIHRRLLTDDHPFTARSYGNLANNLNALGRYVEAEMLLRKSLAIYRRAFTDNHPDTALAYNNLAANLALQRKYALAQPLFEKALEINRRMLTDEHFDTANNYNNLASTLTGQRKYGLAAPLLEKALEINRRLLTDDHPFTAECYSNSAANLALQGKYAEAQPRFEKALEINRRLLTDDHPDTAKSYYNSAANLNAQGNYLEARDQWISAAKSVDVVRIRVAFAGLERTRATQPVRLELAAVLARLGQPADAWQYLEADLGRGLLDELAARQSRRLKPAQRERLGELTSELERLDKLVETTPKGLDQAERAKRFEELKHDRELASIALGEFQTQLMKEHGAHAGGVSTLAEIQAALPRHTALVTWVDLPPSGPNAADPKGEHWGVVVRSRGVPAWVPIAGTGPNGLWTEDDTGLATKVLSELRRRPGAAVTDSRLLVEKLRSQRMKPLEKALGPTSHGEAQAPNLIILPSSAMMGIPVEALFTLDDARTVSYAPSGTVLKFLREQSRPDSHAGLLALGDPIYHGRNESSNPGPLPTHGLLINVVLPGSNAANHGLKRGDVLLAYNGQSLTKKEELKTVADGDKPISVEVWRHGVSSPRDLAPGKLGIVFDPQPAPVAIAEQRELEQILASARGGNEKLNPLPGTRSEVEVLKDLFNSNDRPTRILLGVDASEPETDRLATSGELGKFGFIHLATHGVIDEAIPERSAVILTQTGLPDPLEQVLHKKPVFDGRLSVREIRHGWNLKAELVTLSACETALGRDSGGEGFVGFTQALLMSGARSVCLSLWKVDDRATALLMQRFYANLLGRGSGLSKPMPKAAALSEAKMWLRGLTAKQVDKARNPQSRGDVITTTKVPVAARPFEHPHFWAAFILIGDPS
jgi:tetratricopeptide (TPR) repeat protein